MGGVWYRYLGRRMGERPRIPARRFRIDTVLWPTMMPCPRVSSAWNPRGTRSGTNPCEPSVMTSVSQAWRIDRDEVAGIAIRIAGRDAWRTLRQTAAWWPRGSWWPSAATVLNRILGIPHSEEAP